MESRDARDKEEGPAFLASWVNLPAAEKTLSTLAAAAFIQPSGSPHLCEVRGVVRRHSLRIGRCSLQAAYLCEVNLEVKRQRRLVVGPKLTQVDAILALEVLVPACDSPVAR